jgi:hypothetical protein
MINVDTVYQKVLAIANKEQRGYVTPQEFNLFANQAQSFIFEQYFYDLNQFDRQPGNYMEYSDPITILREKISFFEIDRWQTLNILNAAGDINLDIDLPDLYRLGVIRLNGRTCELMRKTDERHLYQSNPLTKWSAKYPVYEHYGTQGNNNRIKIYPFPVFPQTPPPNNEDSITCTYIRLPARVEWGYTIVNTQAQYNATSPSTRHFELHPSDEIELVTKILEYAGIVMKDPNLYQIAEREEQKIIQQEKQ